jgi:hypothetical protein
MQVLQLSFVSYLAVLAAAKYRVSLIKQVLPPVLDLILVYVKLLCKLCQCLVAPNRC